MRPILALMCAWGLTGTGNGLAQNSAGIVQFSSPAYSIAENAGTAVMTVVRTGDLAQVATAGFATSDGTARAGTNYLAQSGTVQFAAGESTKDIRLSILDDGLVEGDQTVNVTLTNALGGAVLGPQSNALLTIRDNEIRAKLLDVHFSPDVSGTSSSSFVLQNDGKIVWTASFSSYDGNPATVNMLRLNTDGSPDPAFHFAAAPVSPITFRPLVLAMTPEGKILIGGNFKKLGNIAKNGVARLNSDGSLDSTFDPGLGPAGILNQDTDARVEAMAVQPDGKAIVGGVFNRFNGQAHAGLARLNLDGTVDTNFNAQINVSPGAITVLPDGKILVAGGFTIVNGGSRTYIARFNPDGTVDTTFRATFAMGGSISSLAVQPDGKILIAGGFSTSRTVARLNSNGTTDTNFNSGFIGSSGVSGIAFAVGLQSDGKILISGSFSRVGSLDRTNVARLLPDGSVDREFDFPLDSFPTTMLVLPDDDILFAGNFSVAGGVNRSGMIRVHGHPERLHAVQFVSAHDQMNEGTGAGTILVQRDGDTLNAASVDYATTDGTAAADLDYLAQSGTLTFAPLEVTKAITLPVLADALVESDETVTIHLSNPSNGAHLGELSAATVTIHDDNQAPQFVQDTLFVNEDAGAASVTLQRSGDLQQSVSLDYSTADGTALNGHEYTAQKGTITFAPGVASQTIQIPILDNGSVDAPRTVQVTVSNPSVFVHPSTATLAIRDNERPVLFDPAFDPGQKAFGAGNGSCASALVLQPDGKIIVGGCFTNVGGALRGGVARLNVDGTLDRTFDPGAGVTGNGASGSVSALALQPDGKVLLGGAFFHVNGRIHPSIARLNRDGTLDEAFDAGVSALNRGYPMVRQIIVQSDDKILFAGYFGDGLGMGRLNPDGSLDGTFQVAALPPSPIYQLTIALLADKRILAAGSSNEGHPFLVRLDENGSQDPSFHPELPSWDGTAAIAITAVALQPDGKILASQSGANWFSPIFRLNPNGSLDTGFKVHSGPDNSYPTQLEILPNGQILAGGNGLIRINADGSLDRTFELAGVTAFAVWPDGLIIAGGYFDSGIGRIFPDLNRKGGPEFTQGAVSVPERIGAAVLTVERLGDSTQEMTVDFATSDGPARAGVNYVAQHGTVRFAPLQVTNTITIPILNDTLVNEDRSFLVTLSNPSGGSILQRLTTATVVITSNDEGIQFASDNYSVDEAAGFADVLVTRLGDALRSGAVDYVTADGTAKAGSDYLARGGTITFAPGETNQTIRIPILDDGAVEGNETIRLSLSPPQTGAILGTRTNATLVIVDNEFPTLIDSSFDPGKGPTDSSGNSSQVNGVAVLPDGRIMVAGYFSKFNGAARTILARLNSDGSVDLGFRAAPPSSLIQMLVQPDGKLLYFYYANAESFVPNLSRLALDGSSDRSFQTVRFQSTPQVGSSYAAALQPDGKILIQGRFDRVNGVAQKDLVRLNPDGSLDPAFKVQAGPTVPWNGNSPAIVLQPDGKVLVSGPFSSINGVPVNGGARLNSDGSLDTTFSLPDHSGPSLFLAVQADGKILVQQNGIARLNSDGSKDLSFQPSGGSVSSTQFGYPIAVQADGKILFIGGSVTDGNASRSGLIRLNPDGLLDTSLPQLDLQDGNNNFGNLSALALEPDGRILIAGTFVSVNEFARNGIARLFGGPGGQPVISFVAGHPAASEDTGLAVVTVHRSGDTSQAAAIQYATQDGTALANLNYQPASGTLTFEPLETEKTIIIPLLDDGIPNADTTLSILLSDPSSGSNISPGQKTATVRIADRQRPGSIDATFHPVIESTHLLSADITSTGYHIALQPDGKVVVAGDFQRVNGVVRNGICRLNPDGSLDESFDPKGGLALVPDPYNPGRSIRIDSIALQADGKILVRGAFELVNGLNRTNFVRFNMDGSVDARFVPDPVVQRRGIHDRGAGMAVQPDGKILVAETGGPAGTISPVGLARLEPDGSLDGTFVTVQVSGTSGFWGSSFQTIVLPGDGSTVFEGNLKPEPLDYRVGPQQGLTRLKADGSVDTSFQPLMDRLIDVDGGSRTEAVVQPDGKIIVAGLFTQINGLRRPGLARLNRDSSTDTSFSPESPKDDSASYHVRALALQADGKLLVAGSDGSIVRLNGNGSRDLTFDFNATPEHGNGFQTLDSDMALQPDGQILVAALNTEYTHGGQTTVSSLMRLNGDAFLANNQARFRSITVPRTGPIQLQMNVVPSRTYAIEASADLIQWTTIATQTPSNYLSIATDYPAANPPHRFYRVVQTVPNTPR